MTQPSVPLWGRFEAALDNEKPYADPYADVTLSVELTRPDGKTVEFWGFYDGGTTWKFRWMPDQTGTWLYRAAFSDGTHSAAGSFTVEDSDLPGPVSPDVDNPLWFGYRRGWHGLMRSLHLGDAFFAANLPAGRLATFLDWAQAEGYTMLSIGSHYLNRAEPGRGQSWETPRLWPLDAAEFTKTETVLDDLWQRRMIVFPFGGFFGRGSNYPQTLEEQERYVRYVLARFSTYWNILLNVSGPEPLLVKEEKVWIDRPALERMGRMIRELNPFGHMLTVHNKTGDDDFAGADWLDYVTLQGPKTPVLQDLYDGLMRNHGPRKPLYAQETLWSGNKYHPQYSDEELRRNAIVLHMAASAINFSDNGGPDEQVTGDSSTGFSGTLDLTDRRQRRHDILKAVWDFFASLPFYRLSPMPEMVNSGFCLGEAGKQYLIYLPCGETTTLNGAGGTYRVEWISAVNSAIRRSGQEYDDGLLAPPSQEEDWFAYLTRIL